MATAPASADGSALADVDFWDLDLFEHGDPHAVWRRLRRDAPVWWHDRPGGEAFWSVARYDDVKAVMTDPLLFSSADGINIKTDAQRRIVTPAAALGIAPIIQTDPPRHQQVRKLVAHRFTPRAIASLEAELRAITARCLDEAAERREVDFVTDVAHRIPAAITLALLGVDEEHWDRLAELEHVIVTSTDPEYTGGRDPFEVAGSAAVELSGFFAQLVLARLEEPGDDLISTFLQGRVDGEQLRVEQVVAEAGLLLAGGLDTTRAAASAGALLPLLERPDQLELLRADRTLLPTAVEEFVRWSSPIVSEARTATADTTLRDQRIRAGDRVLLWTASANRDEAVFDDPDRYDVRRRPNRHLGFAFGEHHCLGAHLARLTLLVELDELLTRFRSIELTGAPSRVRSNFVGGLKHLPVRLTPR